MAVQTMLAAVSAVPDPGQIVEVRGSTWAVAHVAEQSLPRSPADESAAVLDHAVTLQALGEELTVIWELEVGQTITPAQGLPASLLPEAFDDPHDLAGFVDAMMRLRYGGSAHRWGAAIYVASTNGYEDQIWLSGSVEEKAFDFVCDIHISPITPEP